MDLQSKEINEILTAKATAETNFKTLNKTGKNPHFKSSYATLNDIYDACRLALKEQSLVVYHQTFEDESNNAQISCTLFHTESGQFIRTILPLKTGTAQQTGSEITYMRRYTIQCILSLEGEFDDDGNEAEAIKSDPIIIQKKADEITRLVEETESDILKLLEHCKIPNKQFKDFTTSEYNKVINELQTKLKKQSLNNE